MASLIVGDIDHARDHALYNLRVLGNAVREGYTVICSEPTAALMLQQEYIKLTDDLDAALVAQNTMDVGDYLAGLDARGLLPAPTEPLGVRVGYHQPCHLRALNVGTPGLDLIRTIPDIRVEFIDRGCSGMGGTYGLVARSVPNLPPRRPRPPETPSRPRHRNRRDRMRFLPDPDRTGDHQEYPPSDQAVEPRLRPQPLDPTGAERSQAPERHVLSETWPAVNQIAAGNQTVALRPADNAIRGPAEDEHEQHDTQRDRTAGAEKLGNHDQESLQTSATDALDLNMFARGDLASCLMNPQPE